MLKRIGAIGGAFLIVAAAGTALAKPSQNGRQTTGQGRQAIAPSVVAAFAQNPNGGPGLTAALYALLARDPGLAADIVAEARGAASPNQQTAAGEALAEAQQAYSQGGDQRAAGQIGRAAGFADPQTTASFESAAGYVVVSENDIGRGVGGGANGGFGGYGGGGAGWGGGGGGGSVSGVSPSPN